jgi:hypothetical protein
MKFQVLVADRKTGNGRVYPRSVIEAAIRRAQPRVLERTLTVHHGAPPTLNNAIGIVNKLEMDGERAVAEIQFLDYGEADKIKELAANHKVMFVPDGFGSVENGVVKDYELTAVVAELRTGGGHKHPI